MESIEFYLHVWSRDQWFPQPKFYFPIEAQINFGFFLPPAQVTYDGNEYLHVDAPPGISSGTDILITTATWYISHRTESATVCEYCVVERGPKIA